jgi:PAS domain S-box-containing protein
MDGIEFLKKLRSKKDPTPFIVFTGKGREESAIDALNAGAEYYLQKSGDTETQFAELSHIIRKVVRQRRAKEDREESAARYLSLFNLSPECIYIQDLEGNFIDANPAALALLGYTRDDIPQLSYISLISGEQLTKANERTRSIIESGSQVDLVEYRLQKKNWEFVDVETKGSLIFHGEKPFAILGIARDITERKRAEDALRESEERFHDLLENASDLIQSVKPDGSFIYVNRAWRKTLGYKEEEIQNLTIFDIIHTDSQAHCKEFFQKVISGETIEGVQAKFISKDGVVIDVEGNANCRFIDGKPVATRSIFRDITKRKQTEVALYQSEEQYRILVENASEIIAVIQDELLKFVNRKGMEITGYSLEELTGRPFIEFVHPDDRELVRTNHQRRINGDPAPDYYDVRIVIKDGTVRWLEIKGVLISWNKKPATLNFYTDITKRKQAENAVLNANKKLNTLSSVTRHDILNQLMGLRTFLELSKQDTKDPVLLEYIKKEDQAAEAIQKEIEFTRSYDDIGTHEPTWQVVAEQIESAKKEFKELHGVEVDVAISGIEVFADAPFEKVFYNLMENSLRHGEHVTRIEFSATETQKGLILYYRDNGVGIPAEDKKKLFRKGFGKHTGLGLFLSREILSITGITIAENGEPGKGVLFEIIVPIGGYRFTVTKGA